RRAGTRTPAWSTGAPAVLTVSLTSATLSKLHPKLHPKLHRKMAAGNLVAGRGGRESGLGKAALSLCWSAARVPGGWPGRSCAVLALASSGTSSLELWAPSSAFGCSGNWGSYPSPVSSDRSSTPRSARSSSWSLSGSSSARAPAFAVGEPAAHNAQAQEPEARATLYRRARQPQLAGGRARSCRPMGRLDTNKTPLRAAWDYVALHKRQAQRGGTMSEPSDGASRERDKPWIFRTYAGHSTAHDSNALYRKNLAKGQTGLSVAFDLPTQTGYDSDHALAKGEVGKVGVPISHLGDMRALFEHIPLGKMNTSMTINATAAWLLALYVALADEQGIARGTLQGTTQNDIIKEYLSRGTHVFPPAPSMRLTKDVILFTTREMPKWNPINVCSYHLQEAGATPVQELAFA